MTSRLSPTHWRAIEPLLDTAMALPPIERVPFVHASESDHARRSDVLAMLAACERLEPDTGFLARPAAEQFVSLWEEPHDNALAIALADRFIIEGEAGRGGMGVVYRAHDTRRRCTVALKVLRSTLGGKGPARFRREIALAARLQHPHIVPLLDSGETAGRLWYTMPFLDGETLGVRLRRDAPLSIADAVALLEEIAGGLAYAHANGVIHRDLKPENIMLTGARAVICDFGVARALVMASGNEAQAVEGVPGALTTAGVRIGTLTHMAPEQATGASNIDHRADLFALGVVAYQVLTAALPFTGSSRQATLTALLTSAPAPIAAFRQDTPERLESLVMRLLAKSIADRPDSASDVGAELRNLRRAL